MKLHPRPKMQAVDNAMAFSVRFIRYSFACNVHDSAAARLPGAISCGKSPVRDCIWRCRPVGSHLG